MSDPFKYSGHDNLEVMSLAVNYNTNIYRWLSGDVDKLDRILDFGSGHGEFFNRFYQSENDIYGIELDESVHDQYPSERIFSDLSQLNGKFDLIYSVNVFEHIEDDASLLREIKALINSAGAGEIKIFVPACQELYSAMDKKVGHFRRYSRHGLTQLFEESGFVVTSCRYYDFLGYFASLLYKYGSSSGEINPKSLVIYDKFILPISLMLDKVFGRIVGKNLILEAHLK